MLVDVVSTVAHAQSIEHTKTKENFETELPLTSSAHPKRFDAKVAKR